MDEPCDEVRNISHNRVSGEWVKFGLVSAQYQLCNTLVETRRMHVHALTFGLEERLNSRMEIALYRVIQELLNILLKQAKATEVNIQLNKVENNLNIVVEDNGVGFDVEAAFQKHGMGLRSIETRINKLNGSFSIDSGKGRGTTSIIDLPIS